MATGGSDKAGDGAADGDPVNKLTCAICLDRFRRPKMLSCFHTFCQSCLQGLAGTSPIILCPACRTTVLLPPGGVSELQTNFYIDEDQDSAESSVQQRLCDLCTEDKEATHTCVQCQQRFCQSCQRYHNGLRVTRGHNIVSLTQSDNDMVQKGGASSHKLGEPEMCLKHSDQRLLLHCKQCQTDICMQCKLTQHEGHPTEDVGDSRARARNNLQDVLGGVTQSRQRIAHLIQALNLKRDKLRQKQQQMQQDLQGRSDRLLQWVNQSLNDAVKSVQVVVQDVDKSLQDQLEQLQNRDLALQAPQALMMRVLKDGREADIVALQAQLSASLLEDADLRSMEQELVKNVPMFHVQHGASAVTQMQLREFIGALKPVQTTSLHLQSQSAEDSAGSSSESTANAGKLKSPKELLYSSNAGCSVIAMCALSQSRLWVVYRPEPNAAVMMKLFDADGRVQVIVNSLKRCSGLVPVSSSTVLSWYYNDNNVCLISPDGKLSSHCLSVCVGSLVASASSNKLYLRVGGKDTCSQISFANEENVRFSTVGILHSKLPGGCGPRPGYVSSDGEYSAFIVDGSVEIFTRGSMRISAAYSSYHPPKKSARDVRFCKFDGQELVLVLVKADNKVHLVDHKDGGALVGYLDTGTLTLCGPQCLATDFDQHVWIGCDGGKVVAVDL